MESKSPKEAKKKKRVEEIGSEKLPGKTMLLIHFA